MFRAGAYILLFAMLFSSKPALELLKLPKLFQHYGEHLDRNPAVSFLEFLSMHYWGEDLNDKDGDKDRQLPFKDKVAVNAHYDVAITFSQTDIGVSFRYRQVAYNTRYSETFTVRFADSLFHPPQMA